MSRGSLKKEAESLLAELRVSQSEADRMIVGARIAAEFAKRATDAMAMNLERLYLLVQRIPEDDEGSGIAA